VALSHSSRIQRVACATGQVDAFSMLSVRLASADRWSGIRIQRMQAPGPGELPESYLPGHVVAINDRPAPWTAKWIGGPEVRLSGDGRPDAVCVFPALQPYRCSWNTECACTLIELSPELVDDAAGLGTAAHVQLRPGFLDEDDVIPPLAEALLNLATHDDPSSSVLAESLGLALATYLVRQCATIDMRVQRHRGGVEPHTVRLLDQFIDARMDSPMSLHELAEMVGMSVSHFAHSFRQMTGVAPHQYVLRRRIERARNLLADPQLDVADVALRCGFSHQSHFSETFRRVVGATPRQYRVALGVRREPAASQAPAAKQQKTDSFIAESRKNPSRRPC